MSSADIKSLGSFVWSIAELLRGDFKQSEYGKVVLPFVVLRRLDCIPEATKPATLDAAPLAPFVDRLRRHPEALSQYRADLIARLDRRPHSGCRRRLLVKMDKYVRAPSRMSLRTDLAMKSADRRGEM